VQDCGAAQIRGVWLHSNQGAKKKRAAKEDQGIWNLKDRKTSTKRLTKDMKPKPRTEGMTRI